MARHIDLSATHDLKRLARDVVESGESIILTDRDVELVTLAPVRPLASTRKRLRELKAADLEAFHSAAGAWADVDVEAFMKYVYEGRDRGVRPLQH